mmetsp:Transcript_22641/g.40891  ORF Transcript_22641/g.40891 Transcript_22641/m.40891 type:complete len:567 (+) Transcript_22641:181-1881(+)
MFAPLHLRVRSGTARAREKEKKESEALDIGGLVELDQHQPTFSDDPSKSSTSKDGSNLLQKIYRFRKRGVLLSMCLVIIVSIYYFLCLEATSMHTVSDAPTLTLLSRQDRAKFLQQPPRGHAWYAYQWGDISSSSSNSSSNKNGTHSISMQSRSSRLMDAFVAMDQSPFSSQAQGTFPLVLLANGTLLHSETITQAILGKNPNWRERYPGRILQAEDMIREAARIAAHHVDVQPRFKVLLQKGQSTPILLRHGDYPGCGTQDDVPRLSWCKPVHVDVDCQYSWPIPSYNLWEMFAFPMKYGKVMNNEDEWIRQQTLWNRAYPWSKKVPRAIWRGSPTGMGGDYNVRPRVHLVRQSQKDPTLLDAAFTNHNQIDSSQRMAFEEEFSLRSKRSTMIKQQKYLAIVDIDGNTWSSRFGMQLCLNSVTIKVEPKWVDYFDKEIQPWVHYVPANLTNIIDVVRYVVSDRNQDAMKRIVRNANEWCRTKMTRTQMATDMLWLLVFYAELLDHGDIDPQWRGVWKNNNDNDTASAYQLQLPHLRMTDVEPKHQEWKAVGRKNRGIWTRGRLVY